MKKFFSQLWQWVKDHPWMWVVVLAALLPLSWFGSAYLVTGTDINFPLDPIYRLTSRFQLWDASFITGRDLSVALPTQVFAGVQALLSWLGFGNTWVEQLELVFWLLASGLSGAFFFTQLLLLSASSATKKDEIRDTRLRPATAGQARYEIRKRLSTIDSRLSAQRWGTTLGVTVYLFNIFLINRINEIDVATLGAYVFVPALLGFSLAVIGDRIAPWKAALGTALMSVLGVGLFANPPLVLVLAIFYVAFVIVLLLASDRAKRIRFAKFFGIFLSTFVLVHLWWLLPYVGSLNVLVGGEDGLASLNLLDWVDGVSRHNNLWNVIRMQGAWDWYEKGLEDKPYVPTALHYQRNIGVILLSIILPLGALWSMKVLPTLDRVGKRLWWFFAVALVISLIYSMGTNNVISTFIYDATSKIVPGFWLIRSPWYKFGYVTVLGYGVLFAFLGSWLAKTRDTRYEIRDTKTTKFATKISRWLLRWSIPLLAIAVILYAYPMLLGRTQLFPYTRLKSGVPDYVREATNYLNDLTDSHRVVTLPQEDAYNYTWGYGSGGDVIGHFLHRPVLSNETFAGGNRQGSDALLAAFYRSLYDSLPGEMSLLLDYLDGQYFVHKNDAKFADYGDTDSPDFIRERLSKHTNVELVRSFGQWDLYQRTDEAPGRIITGTKIWTMFGPSADYLKELPYYLEHLSGEDELTQFYTRPVESEAGPGTTRSLMKVEMPRVEGDTLIETMDFDAPFDGPITVEQITGSASGTLTLNNTTVSDGSSAELKRESNVFSVTPQRLPDVIDNPSFAEPVELGFPGPGPWNFSDSNKTAPGDAKFKIRQIPGSDDTPGIELEATNHILGLHQWIQDFENLAIYRISFDYKHVTGQAPAYTTWQATSAVDKPNGTLPISSDWQHFSTYVQTDARSTGLLVYLYAGAELGETTINHYDNVRVEKVGTRTTFAFFSPEAERTAPPNISFEQQSNTHWTAHIEKSEGPYLLSFLESFNPGWVAEVAGKQIPEDRHVKVNGYANAWWMDQNTEPIDVNIRYQPQDRFALYGWVSIISILLVVGALLFHAFRLKGKKILSSRA